MRCECGKELTTYISGESRMQQAENMLQKVVIRIGVTSYAQIYIARMHVQKLTR